MPGATGQANLGNPENTGQKQRRMIMRKKGFTLVELLIVIAIIALLMGILMPALARVRMYAYRMTCGTNLAGLGKAIMLYANDSRGEAYPLPGCNNTVAYAKNGYLTIWWGGTPGTTGTGTPMYVYGEAATTSDAVINNGGGHATIGALFYLLVKYQDVAVKQFVCKGDVGAKVFKLTDSKSRVITEFAKAWDFGAQPGIYCSYSYHNPFSPNSDGGSSTTRQSGFPVGSSSPPASPLAADRNPMLDKNVSYLDKTNTDLGGLGSDGTKKTPKQYWDDDGGPRSTTPITFRDPDLMWNSFAHQREGQNVLFNDAHVNFERTSNVGIDNDNIWQSWNQAPLGTGQAKYDREVGGYFPTGTATSIATSTVVYRDSSSSSSSTVTGKPGQWFPMDYADALLINDQQDCAPTTW